MPRHRPQVRDEETRLRNGVGRRVTNIVRSVFSQSRRLMGGTHHRQGEFEGVAAPRNPRRARPPGRVAYQSKTAYFRCRKSAGTTANSSGRTPTLPSRSLRSMRTDRACVATCSASQTPSTIVIAKNNSGVINFEVPCWSSIFRIRHSRKRDATFGTLCKIFPCPRGAASEIAGP